MSMVIRALICGLKGAGWAFGSPNGLSAALRPDNAAMVTKAAVAISASMNFGMVSVPPSTRYSLRILRRPLKRRDSSEARLEIVADGAYPQSAAQFSVP